MVDMEKLSSNLENRIVRYDEAVEPDQLTAHPLNFRRHPVAQRKALRASIEGHGWVAPVIATVDGTVIDGHARVEEALSGGVTVPVVFVDMDDDEAGSMILRLDPIAAMASHDSDVLGELLAREEWVPDESALSETLNGLLGSGEAAGGGEPEDGEIPQVAEPVSAPGDVWLLRSEHGMVHRVVCGDCRDDEAVDVAMGGAQINMAFTSPPYAEQREYDASSGFKPIPPDEYVEWFEPVAANVARHLVSDGSWFVNIKPSVTPDGMDTDTYVMDLVLAHVRKWGWHWATEFCWERNGVPKSVSRRFKNQFEPVHQFARGAWKMRPSNVMHSSDAVPVARGAGAGTTAWDGRGSNGGQGTGGSFFGGSSPGLAYPGNRLPTFAGSHEALGHGAAFPVGLPQWFSKAYTDEHDHVYDPFMGSGSTLIACELERRTCHGIELSPGYVDIICARWQKLTGVMPERESTGEIVDFIGGQP
jgi:site-specific DNA-methyltransferase (adenine-specific)